MVAKILVVDDEPDLEVLIQSKFKKAIKDKEFEFIFAHNGLEAMNLLRNDSDLNIILTDINMPVMDGLTLLGTLSELNRPYRAAVVSAYGDMVNIRSAMNKGASDFVMKPIDFHDFEFTLRKMISEYWKLHEALTTEEHLKDIQKELDIAKAIQEAMLPSDFHPLPKFPLKIAGKMTPAKEVGGDFFDFFALDNHRLALFIADVSGKSISACLYMIVTKSILRALAPKNLTCEEVLKQMNELLHTDNPSCMFVTAFYAILDSLDGSLTFCNAGHNFPYIINKEGVVKKLALDKSIALGISNPPPLPYKEGFIKLEDQDCLFLFTDGITDAMNPDLDLFTNDRLEKILASQKNSLPESIMDAVGREIKAFAGSEAQHDDLTLLAIQYNSPSPPS